MYICISMYLYISIYIYLDFGLELVLCLPVLHVARLLPCVLARLLLLLVFLLVENVLLLAPLLGGEIWRAALQVSVFVLLY